MLYTDGTTDGIKKRIFSAFPIEGYVEAGGVAVVAVTVNTTGIPPSRYDLVVEAKSLDGVFATNASVPVQVTGEPFLVVSTDTITIISVPGDVVAESVVLLNVGSEELSWVVGTVEETTLSVTPSAGSLSSGAYEEVSVTLSVPPGAAVGSNITEIVFRTPADPENPVALTVITQVIPGPATAATSFVLDPSGPESPLEGSISLPAGTPRTLFIQMFDAAGNARTTSSTGTLVVEGEGVLSFPVTNLGDGTMLFKAWFEAAGTHQLMVRYDGEAIANSPVIVVVSAGTFDAAKSKILHGDIVCMPRSTCAESVAGMPVPFTTDLRDTYNNTFTLDETSESVILTYQAVAEADVAHENATVGFTVAGSETLSAGSEVFTLESTVAGRYVVSINMNGEPSSSAGFFLQVLTNPDLDASSSGFAEDVGATTVAGSAVDVGVILYDAFANRIESEDGVASGLQLVSSSGSMGISEILWDDVNDMYVYIVNDTVASSVSLQLLHENVLLDTHTIQVSVSSASAAHTQVETLSGAVCVPGVVCAGGHVGPGGGPRLQVRVRDNFGNIIAGYNENRCVYRIASDSQFCASADNGMMEFQPSSTLAGAHDVTLWLDGTEISGSGFLINFNVSSDDLPIATTSQAVFNGEICMIASLCGSVVAGTPSVLAVELRDSYGNVLLNGSKDLVSATFDNDALLPVLPLTNPMSFQVLPTSANPNAVVRVLVSGTPVSNSWFWVEVQAGPLDSLNAVVRSVDENYRVCNATVACVTITTDDLAIFHIYPFDAFGNALVASGSCSVVVDDVSVGSQTALDGQTVDTCVASASGDGGKGWYVLSLRQTRTQTSFDESTHDVVITSLGGEVAEISFLFAAVAGEPAAMSAVSSMPQTAMAGKEWQLEVTPVDSYNNRLMTPASRRFVVDVVPATDNATSVFHTTTQASGGPDVVETAVILVDTSGTYRVLVRFAGVEIEGSGQIVTVSSDEELSAVSSIVALETGSLVAGDDGVALLYPKDRFGNLLEFPVDADLFVVSVSRGSGEIDTSVAPYSISYRATVAGTNVLNVTFADAVVAVVDVFVLPGAAAPESSSIVWGGGAACSAGEVCASVYPGDYLTFSIVVKDRFGNVFPADGVLGWNCTASVSPVLKEAPSCVESTNGGFSLVVVVDADASLRNYTVSATLSASGAVTVVPGSGFFFSVVEMLQLGAISAAQSFVTREDQGASQPCTVGDDACEILAAGESGNLYLQQRGGDGVAIEQATAVRCSVGVSVNATTPTYSKDCVYDSHGMYHIPVDATVTGEYYIFVKLESEEVTNSGFRVEIVPAVWSKEASAIVSLRDLGSDEPHRTTCLRNEPCGPTVTAGSPAYYGLEPRDLYGNAVLDDVLSVCLFRTSVGVVFSALFNPSASVPRYEAAVVASAAGNVGLEVAVQDADRTNHTVGSVVIRVAAGSLSVADSYVEDCPSSRTTPCARVAAGVEKVLLVLGMDTHGNSVGVSFKVQVNDSATVLETSLRTDKAAEFTFTRTLSGSYMISVSYEEELVSEVMINVVCGPVDPVQTAVFPAGGSSMCQQREVCVTNTAGNETTFTVRLQDEFGNAVVADVGYEVRLSGEAAVDFAAVVSPDSDAVSFTVLLVRSGTYEVEVKAGGRLLDSAPTLLQVESLPNVDISGAELEYMDIGTAMAGNPSNITVILKDAYGNPHTSPSTTYAMRLAVAFILMNDIDASATDAEKSASKTTFSVAPSEEGYVSTYYVEQAGVYEVMLLDLESTEDEVTSAWTMQVAAGAPSQNMSYVVYGNEVCEPQRQCGCTTDVLMSIDYVLILIDRFGNRVTGRTDISCAYTTKSIGVAPAEVAVWSLSTGVCPLSVEAFFVAEYEVGAYLEGSEVQNSRFRALFEWSDIIDVNATQSLVGYLHANTSEADRVWCQSGAACGPAEVPAGQTVEYLLVPRNAAGNQTALIGGLLVTFLLSGTDVYSLEAGLVLPNATYAISVSSTLAGEKFVRVFLGVSEVGEPVEHAEYGRYLFSVEIVPADPDPDHCLVSYEGTQCKEAVRCLSSTDAGELRTFLLTTSDVYGNQWTRSSSPGAVQARLSGAKGAVYTGQGFPDVVDQEDGSYLINIAPTRSSTYTVGVFLWDEEVFGSNFLAEYVPSNASMANSAIEYCGGGGTTCTECDAAHYCPGAGLQVDSAATYRLVVRDVFGNRISEGALFGEFLFDCSRLTDGFSLSSGPVSADGSIFLNFDAVVSGDYRLHIYYTFEGNHFEELHDSPARIYVFPGGADVDNSVVVYQPEEAGLVSLCSSAAACPGNGVRAGRSEAYVVRTYDQYNNSRNCSEWCPEENLVVSFTFSGPVFSRAVYNSRPSFGEYSFEVTLTVAGTYEASVSIDEELLPQSRFFVNVTAAAHEPSSSFLTRNGVICTSLDYCSDEHCCTTAGVAAKYGVSLLDPFGNDVHAESIACEARVYTLGDFNSGRNSGHNQTCVLGPDGWFFEVPMNQSGQYVLLTFVDGQSVSNEYLYLHVEPAEASGSHSYVQYRSESGLQRTCVQGQQCGESKPPGATQSYVLVLVDAYGNHLAPASGDYEAFLVVGENTYQPILAAGALWFAVAELETGLQPVYCSIRGEEVSNSGFFVSFRTTEPLLLLSLDIEMYENGNKTSVVSEVQRLLASELALGSTDLQVSSDYGEYFGLVASNSSAVDRLTYEYASPSLTEVYEVSDTAAGVNVSVAFSSRTPTYDVISSYISTAVIVDYSGAPSPANSLVYYEDSSQWGAPNTTSVIPCDTETAGSLCPAGTVSAGTTLSYVIQTKDQYGNKLAIDFAESCVYEVLNTDGTAVGQGGTSGSCANNRDGTYSCHALIGFYLASDQYMIRFSLAGQRVGGTSGLRIQPTSAPATDPHKSSISVALLDGPTLAGISEIEGVTADGGLLVHTVAKDVYGNIRADAAGDPFTVGVQAVNNASDTASFPCERDESAPGLYTCVVVRTAENTYALDVSFGNISVVSSEYYVSPGSFSAAASVATGDGTHTVTVNEAASVTVSSYDAFGNPQADAQFMLTFETMQTRTWLPIIVVEIPKPEGATSFQYTYETSLDVAGYIRLNITDPLKNHVEGSPFTVRSMCPPGYVHSSTPSGEVCDLCDDEHILCDRRNITLRNLESREGSWRRSADTYEFDDCMSNVVINFGDSSACRGVSTSCHPCIGVVGWSDEDGPDGQCALGYESRLCSLCSMGYTRSGTFECDACPEDPSMNLAWIIGVFAVAFLIIGVLIRNQIETADEGDYYTIVIKIMCSYLQIISLLRLIDFDWPKPVIQLFEKESAVVSPSSQVLSLDCLLDRPGNVVFFEKIKFFMLIPPVVVVLLLAVFGTVYLWHTKLKLKFKSWKAKRKGGDPDEVYRQQKENKEKALKKLSTLTGSSSDLTREEILSILHPSVVIRGNVAVGMIVFLFMAYPSLSTEVFLLFSCKRLSDGHYYVTHSMDVECGGPAHMETIFPWGVGGILVYVIGIPLFGWYSLFRARNSLHHPKLLYEELYQTTQERNEYYLRTGRSHLVRYIDHKDLKIESDADRILRYTAQMRYGFLYFGYRPQYYWWEVWVMVRKSLVVAITVFMSNTSVMVQGLTLVALSVVSMMLHFTKQPYASVSLRGKDSDLLNRMEIIAIATCTVTIFLGMYFLEESRLTSDAARILLTALVFVLNLGSVWYFLRGLFLVLCETKGFIGNLMLKVRGLASTKNDKVQEGASVINVKGHPTAP